MRAIPASSRRSPNGGPWERCHGRGAGNVCINLNIHRRFLWKRTIRTKTHPCPRPAVVPAAVPPVVPLAVLPAVRAEDRVEDRADLPEVVQEAPAARVVPVAAPAGVPVGGLAAARQAVPANRGYGRSAGSPGLRLFLFLLYACCLKTQAHA